MKGKRQLTDSEFKAVVTEISERLKDMVYMEAEDMVKEFLEENNRAFPKVASTGSPINFHFTVKMFWGDIFQVVGRMRRGKL